MENTNMSESITNRTFGDWNTTMTESVQLNDGLNNILEPKLTTTENVSSNLLDPLISADLDFKTKLEHVDNFEKNDFETNNFTNGSSKIDEDKSYQESDWHSGSNKLLDNDDNFGPETCVDVTDDIVMITDNSADTNLIEQSNLSHSKDTLPSSSDNPYNPFDNKNAFLDMENDFLSGTAHLDTTKSTPILSPDDEEAPIVAEGDEFIPKEERIDEFLIQTEKADKDNHELVAEPQSDGILQFNDNNELESPMSDFQPEEKADFESVKEKEHEPEIQMQHEPLYLQNDDNLHSKSVEFEAEYEKQSAEVQKDNDFDLQCEKSSIYSEHKESHEFLHLDDTKIENTVHHNYDNEFESAYVDNKSEHDMDEVMHFKDDERIPENLADEFIPKDEFLIETEKEQIALSAEETPLEYHDKKQEEVFDLQKDEFAADHHVEQGNDLDLESPLSEVEKEEPASEIMSFHFRDELVEEHFSHDYVGEVQLESPSVDFAPVDDVQNTKEEQECDIPAETVNDFVPVEEVPEIKEEQETVSGFHDNKDEQETHIPEAYNSAVDDFLETALQKEFDSNVEVPEEHLTSNKLEEHENVVPFEFNNDKNDTNVELPEEHLTRTEPANVELNPFANDAEEATSKLEEHENVAPFEFHNDKKYTEYDCSANHTNGVYGEQEEDVAEVEAEAIHVKVNELQHDTIISESEHKTDFEEGKPSEHSEAITEETNNQENIGQPIAIAQPQHEICDDSEDEWKYMQLKEGDGEKKQLSDFAEEEKENNKPAREEDTDNAHEFVEQFQRNNIQFEEEEKENSKPAEKVDKESVQEIVEQFQRNNIEEREIVHAAEADSFDTTTSTESPAKENTSEEKAHSDEYDEEMNSQLNPNAKEFIPTFSPPANIASNGYDNVISSAPRRILDEVVAQSPRKGRESNMENIFLPSENEFDQEIARRPHDEWAEEPVSDNEHFVEEDSAVSPIAETVDIQELGEPVPQIYTNALDSLNNADMKTSIYVENSSNDHEQLEDVLNSIQPIPNFLEEDQKNNSVEILTTKEDLSLSYEEKDVVSPATDEYREHFAQNEVPEEQIASPVEEPVVKEFTPTEVSSPLLSAPVQEDSVAEAEPETPPKQEPVVVEPEVVPEVVIEPTIVEEHIETVAAKAVEVEKNLKNATKSVTQNKAKVPEAKKPGALAANTTSTAQKKIASKPVSSTLKNVKSKIGAPTAIAAPKPRTLAGADKPASLAEKKPALIKSKVESKVGSALASRKPLAKPATTISSAGKVGIAAKTSTVTSRVGTSTTAAPKPRPASASATSTIRNVTAKSTIAPKTSTATKSSPAPKLSPRGTLTSTLRKTEALKSPTKTSTTTTTARISSATTTTSSKTTTTSSTLKVSTTSTARTGVTRTSATASTVRKLDTLTAKSPSAAARKLEVTAKSPSTIRRLEPTTAKSPLIQRKTTPLKKPTLGTTTTPTASARKSVGGKSPAPIGRSPIVKKEVAIINPMKPIADAEESNVTTEAIKPEIVCENEPKLNGSSANELQLETA